MNRWSKAVDRHGGVTTELLHPFLPSATRFFAKAPTPVDLGLVDLICTAAHGDDRMRSA